MITADAAPGADGQQQRPAICSRQEITNASNKMPLSTNKFADPGVDAMRSAWRCVGCAVAELRRGDSSGLS